MSSNLCLLASTDSLNSLCFATFSSCRKTRPQDREPYSCASDMSWEPAGRPGPESLPRRAGRRGLRGPLHSGGRSAWRPSCWGPGTPGRNLLVRARGPCACLGCPPAGDFPGVRCVDLPRFTEGETEDLRGQSGGTTRFAESLSGNSVWGSQGKGLWET